MHTFESEKREKVQQIKREGSIKGEGGLYKELKIPALPPKLPRSGVTFHSKSNSIVSRTAWNNQKQRWKKF